jgi:hypothetical protein
MVYHRMLGCSLYLGMHVHVGSGVTYLKALEVGLADRVLVRLM